MAAPLLLTDEAGPVMRALAGANAGALAEDFELAKLVRTLWDPWNCPAAELSLLAWAWSVDYFDPKWSEPRKRRVIAESRLYHARKTTVAGVRMALGYRDAKLVRAYLPRQGFIVDREPDAEVEAAWRRGLSELRVYDAGPIVLARRLYGFLGRNLFVQDDALKARTASLVKGKVETPLRIIPNEDPTKPGDRFVLPIAPRNVLIVGRPGPMFLAPDRLPVKTVAVSYGALGDAFTRPLAALGDQGGFIESRRQMKVGTFPPLTGVGRGGLFIAAPNLILRGFLSLKFSDQPGRLASRGPSNVLGRSRVKRAPYTANYLVKWKVEAPRSAFPPGRKVAPASEPLVRGFMDAIASVQAARDRASISLSATRRLTYADARQIKAGTRYGNRLDN